MIVSFFCFQSIAMVFSVAPWSFIAYLHGPGMVKGQRVEHVGVGSSFDTIA
jgi:hypothetical protein